MSFAYETSGHINEVKKRVFGQDQTGNIFRMHAVATRIKGRIKKRR